MRTLMFMPIVLLSIVSPALANECEDLSRAGTIKTNVQMADCLNQVDLRNAGGRNSDLLRLLTLKRMAVARDIDRGKLSPSEGAIRIQAVFVEVTSEIHRRDALLRLSQPSQPQPNPRGSVTYCLNGPATICF